MAEPSEDRSEIVFFDVETTVPTRPGQGFAILEFGAILVCPRKLEELRSYSTLVRPSNPSLISSLSVRCNGITRDAVSSAPSFSDIADTVFDILHGRIWAGHNIVKFDCHRIREAFKEIGRAAPEPRGTFDSLALLSQKFGRRAGDMKMASLASYFGLGKQTHRSLDDVRMNLEVVKYCATVLFLESSLPDTFPENSWISPNAVTRSRLNGKSPPERTCLNTNMPSSSSKFEKPLVPPMDKGNEGNHPIFSLLTSSTTEEIPNLVATDIPISDPFDMAALSDEISTNSLQQDATMEEGPVVESSEILFSESAHEGCSGRMGFLDPNEVSISSIRAQLVQYFHGVQKITLLHNNVTLKIYCPHLKVRFGLSTKYTDNAGRPRLNFLVDASPSLCSVLDACDNVARKLSVELGSSSEWRSVVNKRFNNCPTLRLHIPTAVHGDIAQYATEIYQKDPSGTTQRLVFSKFDAAELNTWFKPGTFVDAYLSLESYDFHDNAGIRLVAKKLIIHRV